MTRTPFSRNDSLQRQDLSIRDTPADGEYHTPHQNSSSTQTGDDGREFYSGQFNNSAVVRDRSCPQPRRTRRCAVVPRMGRDRSLCPGNSIDFHVFRSAACRSGRQLRERLLIHLPPEHGRTGAGRPLARNERRPRFDGENIGSSGA